MNKDYKFSRYNSKKQEKSQPLVSIIVITYNSSRYILETLNSALRQTYQNIELIISDDYSLDDTQLICADWLGKNSNRFITAKLIRSEKNTGIPANCNRGIKASNGEWIKLIAGDDILFDDAIEKLVNNIDDSGEIYIGKMKSFAEKSDASKVIIEQEIPNERTRSYFYYDANFQHDLLKYWNFVPAPTSFIRKSLLVKLGYYDERFFLCEDAPFWLKATKNGHKLSFCNEYIAYYRICHNSASKVQGYYNINTYNCLKSVAKKLVIPDCDVVQKIIIYEAMIIESLRFKILVKHYKNRRCRAGNILSVFLGLFNILLWLKIFKSQGIGGFLNGLCNLSLNDCSRGLLTNNPRC